MFELCAKIKEFNKNVLYKQLLVFFVPVDPFNLPMKLLNSVFSVHMCCLSILNCAHFCLNHFIIVLLVFFPNRSIQIREKYPFYLILAKILGCKVRCRKNWKYPTRFSRVHQKQLLYFRLNSIFAVSLSRYIDARRNA